LTTFLLFENEMKMVVVVLDSLLWIVDQSSVLDVVTAVQDNQIVEVELAVDVAG